ncbi:MAG TPA: FlgD immunoglobulin-like domain containing protein, partial [Candidatus Eisenbacteria bacterium]|nr:FlgD immunoglobulin-like domain containing protein [Candidatus Eisenbacteria bacterium]
GLWFMGSGFGQSESVAHPSFVSTYLRASLLSGDYRSLSGNSNPSVTLDVMPPPSPMGPFGLRSNAHDVFVVNSTSPPGQAKAYYENVGSFGPYVASVYAPNSGGIRPFISLLDGFDLAELGSLGNASTTGRRQYAYGVLSGPFGSLSCTPACPLTTCTDVPMGADASAFLSLASNPTHGSATIRLVLPKTERATVAIYDVTGRRLMNLADGQLDEGPHTFDWDGTGAGGARVAGGVYWVRVTTASGIRAARMFVLLR